MRLFIPDYSFEMLFKIDSMFELTILSVSIWNDKKVESVYFLFKNNNNKQIK